tara:strand:- start:322 stop:2289 length:1968 start_codon:yes stop_codon:yes gene_type:complete
MHNKENQYQALASWLSYRLDSWRTHRNINYIPMWDEYYRLWRGIWSAEDKTRQSERSRLIAPALQQAVESSVAELEEATFGRGKWFDIKDDMLDQDPTDAEYIRNLLQEDLEKAGCKDAICEVFLNGAIYGTGIGKIVVKQTMEKMPSEENIGGTMATTRTVVEIPSIDVHVEPISPKEFLIDPSANSINEALGVAHEVIKPRYHIVNGIRSGIYRDVPLDGDYDTVKFGYDPETKQADESDSVKITEYWGKVPKRFLKANANKDDFEYDKSASNELVEAVVTMCNDQHILRVEVNAFMMEDRPFISYQHDIVPNKFWGRGVCEKGYNPQKALDAEMRARIDSLALTTTPMMAADATRLPRGVKFEVRAGKTVLTNGNPREAIMPLDMGTTDQSTFMQVQSLQNMIQMGTGSADTAGSGAGNETASGMSMMQSASIKRQKRTLMNFQNTFLIPLINKCMYRKIQFDIDRYPVTDYKFVPYSTMGIMAKELEMTQMVSMLQTIPPDSPAYNIILLALFQNSSIHNRDQIVNALMQGDETDPQMEQMQQMGMQLEMQQLEANVQKTLAEAKEEEARAMKHQSEAMQNQPNEIDFQAKLLKLQKDQIGLQKIAADIENKRSETARNIPEVEHLKSETILNLANARAAGNKTDISNRIQ